MLHRPRIMMRTAIYSGLFLATGIASAMAADPTGDWRVADGVANIRVAQCGGSMWGVVAWEKTAGGRDTNNPDVSKQNRPTLGMPILIDMKKKPGVDEWEGQVYNAKDGQLYSSTITPNGPDQLEIQGCVMGFLCGGETWTRVGPPIPGSPASGMTKGAQQNTTTQAKAHASTTGSAAAATGSSKPVAKMSGQKQVATAQRADPLGDICLLPDIAGFAH